MNRELKNIDDFVKDSLKDYKVKPSGNLWRKLWWKLLAQQISSFSLLLSRKAEPKHDATPVVPLYRRQWFNYAVAASVTILILLSFVIFRNIPDQNINGHGKFAQTDDLNKNKSESNIIIQGATKKENNTIQNINSEDLEQLVSKEQKNIVGRPGSMNPERSNNINNKYFDNPNLKKESIDKFPDEAIASNTVNYNENPPTNNNRFNASNYAVQPINVNNNPDPYITAGKIDQQDTSTSGNQEKEGEDGAELNNKTVEVNTSEKENRQSLTTSEDLTNDIDTGIVEEKTDVELIFPNVFTPNSDGINDYFEIVNLEKYNSNHLVVSDRTGKIVYEKRNYLNNWNGKNLKDGVYYYILIYNDQMGEHSKRGLIHIYRETR